MLTSWFMLLVTTENCVLLRYPHFVFIFGHDFKCCLCYCLLFLVYINKSTTLPLGTKTILAVWFRNRLTIAGLEPVLNHTEKSCIATYYKQFSTNIKIKINTSFSFIILYFNICGKLCMIGCDKYLLQEMLP